MESRERVAQIQYKLTKFGLTIGWLIARLERNGMIVDKTTVSSSLNGNRKGPQAEKIVDICENSLNDYEQKMFEVL